MSKRRFVSESSAFAGAFAGIVMLLRAGPMADGARAGLSLCSGLVVPTLFPEAVESLSRFESGVPYALSVSAPAFVSLLCMLSLFLLSLVPQNSKYSIEKDCVI